MGRVVLITLSEYRAIMQWDDEGGKNADITYEIIPDLPDDSSSKIAKVNNSENSDPLCREKDSPQVLALSRRSTGSISVTVTDQ
jgi:hypothetical protein